jgi:glyoxylase-like metal-dependent hydrolase (beta-lactamase superfamily II)
MIFSVSLLCQDKQEIKVEAVSEDLYVISGIGGNIVVLKAEGKLLMVDAGIGQAGELLKETISKKFNLPVEILINTHYHPDHTGGNKAIAEGSLVISHKNCLATLNKLVKEASKSEGGKKLLEQILLPNEVFLEKKEIKFGDESLLLLYLGPGHTRGDIVVIFKKNKVIHTGDLFFHNIAPYIDVRDGSDTENWVKAINRLSVMYKGFTVVPGHGEVTDMVAFLKFAGYLKYLNDSVKDAIAKGKSSNEAREIISFKDFSHIKEVNKYMTKKNNVDWVYKGLSRDQK